MRLRDDFVQYGIRNGIFRSARAPLRTQQPSGTASIRCLSFAPTLQHGSTSNDSKPVMVDQKCSALNYVAWCAIHFRLGEVYPNESLLIMRRVSIKHAL